MARGRLGRRLLSCAAAGLVVATAFARTGPVDAQTEAGQSIATAKATAVLLKVAPTVGALELAFGAGVSVAELRNQLAQSQSQSTDLGLIGTALTGEQCDGSDPSFQPDDLPQPVRVDNRQGETSARAEAAPGLGTLFGTGVQEVRATPQPLSEATSTFSRSAFGEALLIDNGRARATTEVVDGPARVAHSEVTADLTIPGVLRLSGLRWDALHRTGTEEDAHAGFTIGSAEVLGQPVATDDVPVADVIDGLNTALTPLGVTLAAPMVERFTEPADLVRVSPLRITYSGGVSGLVLGPVLDASRQFRDDLAAQAIEFNCKLSTAFLLSEIGIGQLAGTGSTVIDVGGAEATTGLAAIENPFGDGGLLPPVLPPEVLPTETASPALTPPVATPAAPPAAPPSNEVPTRPIGDFERVCESVHPFRWPSCSAGAGPFVGLGALAATAAIGAFDWRHRRRRFAAAEARG